MSRPRKTFATNVPPGLRAMFAVAHAAARRMFRRRRRCSRQSAVRSAGCPSWRLRRSTRKLRVHRASRQRFPWCMHEAAWAAAARFAGAVTGGVPQQVRRDVDGRKQQLRLDIPATNPPSVPREYRLRPLSIDGAGVGCPGCALRVA